MKINFIFDPEEQAFVEKTIMPLVKDSIHSHQVFDGDNISLGEPGDYLLLYLSDQQIKKLLPLLATTPVAIAALPHPEAKSFCTLSGVESNLEKAVKHFKSHPNKVKIDLLYCNGRPVFNHLIIGQTFQLATSNIYKSIGYWKRNKYFIIKFLQLRPFKIEITQKKGNSFKTAVAGIMVSAHKNQSKLSQQIPGDSFYNDGLLHALFLCPRSLMELITYAISSLWRKHLLPEFGAHIKTDRLKLTGIEQKLMYTEDGDTHNSDDIELELKKKQLEIIPGALLDQPEEAPKSKEVIKIQSLPTGEAAAELSKGKLPFIKRASTEEFQDLFLILRNNATIKNTYLMLMILSTALATLGLFANSSPVVIGAMILAPLMGPIISLSMASLRQDKRLILNSIYTILAGLATGFIFAVLITLITPIRIPNAEILARTSPNLLDLGIAVVSGIAGAYALSRESISQTLAGVAIAVALVPPLAVTGIGFGWLDWNIFFGAFLLLLTNLSGIVLAGAITFLVLGFSPFKLAKKGVLISFTIVIIFCVPLAIGFNRIISEHQIIQTLNGWETENVILKDIRVQNNDPLRISLKLVSATVLEDKEIKLIKARIEEKLDREVELEILISLIR